MKITTKELKSIILEVLEEASAQRQFSFMKQPKVPTQRQLSFMTNSIKSPNPKVNGPKLFPADPKDISSTSNFKPKYYDGKPANIEEEAIRALVYGQEVVHWNGPVVQYWNKNFDSILKRYPGLEKDLVKRIIYEFGADRSANHLYTEYCIPLPFFQKHEKEILGNSQAARGIITLISDQLIWRQDSNLPTDQAAVQDLSPIELYIFRKYRSYFPEEKVSVVNKGR